MEEDDEVIDKLKEFHGHICPGLLLGYQVSNIFLREFEKPKDEEIVAIVETDACSIDAIQFMTGCTLGKGNLIIRNYGKHVYTFIDRKSRDAIRIALDFEKAKNFDWSKGKIPPKDMFNIKRMKIKRLPRKARIRESIRCEMCGEGVMKGKERKFKGKVICIPCYKSLLRNSKNL